MTDEPQNTEEIQEETAAAPAWEAELDFYPLQDKSEDPKWALRTVWTWIGFVVFCFVGIVTLLVAGFFTD